MPLKTIYVKFQIPGLHFWPEAPNYLRELHRHVFHVKVLIEVAHNNRALEFMEVREILIRKFKRLGDREDTAFNFGHKSCEQLAEELFESASSLWPVVQVDVSEDGENGATCVREVFVGGWDVKGENDAE